MAKKQLTRRKTVPSAQTVPSSNLTQKPGTNDSRRTLSWETLFKTVSAVAFLISVYFAWVSSSADAVTQQYEARYQNYLSLRSLSHQHAAMAIASDTPDDYSMASTVASDAVASIVLQPEFLKEPDETGPAFSRELMNLIRLKDVTRVKEVDSLASYRKYIKELGDAEQKLSVFVAEEMKTQKSVSQKYQTAFVICQAIGFTLLVLGELAPSIGRQGTVAK